MFQFEEEAMLVQDREDLIQLLRMRFGDISPQIIQQIYEIRKMDVMERLFIVAANSRDLHTFIEELEVGEDSFKLVGERFNPIEYISRKEDAHGQ